MTTDVHLWRVLLAYVVAPVYTQRTPLLTKLPPPCHHCNAAPFPGEDNEMQSCISRTGQWRNWLSPQGAKKSNDLLVFISLHWTDGISRRVALSQCIYPTVQGRTCHLLWWLPLPLHQSEMPCLMCCNKKPLRPNYLNK